jgi:hypothetical protein
MTAMKTFAAVGLFALALALAGPAGAQTTALSDFSARSNVYDLTSPIIDLAVTPNDRFVVVLSENSLHYLDTWNFTMIKGSASNTVVAYGSTVEAVSLAISPDGNYALVGRSDGKLAVVSLTPLYNLLPTDELTTELAVTYSSTFAVGASLDPLIAIPSYPASNTAFLFFGAEDSLNSYLYYTPFTDGTAGAGAFIMHNVKALAGGLHAGFELYQVALNHSLRIWSCSSASGCLTQGEYGLGGDYASVAGDRVADAFAITINLITRELLLMDTTDFGHIKFGDTIKGPFKGELAILDEPQGHSDVHDLLFSGSTVAGSMVITEISFANLTFGSTDHIAVPATSHLAPSSGADGYIYAAAGTTLTPVTANPWLEEAQIMPGATVTAGFTVDVLVATPGDTILCELSSGATFGSWRNPLASLVKTVPAGGDTITCSLPGSVQQLASECENLLTVLATDEYGRQGRTAVAAFRDTAPPAQGFSVGFGDRRVIYSFTTIDLCDLNRIEVWYAADPAAVTDYATLSAHAELANTYYSPTAGSVVEGDISGLVNGQTYYVWVVTIDNTGHATIGSYQSSMPEPTSSLTDLTGEDGGFNCFSSVGGPAGARPGRGGGFI